MFPYPDRSYFPPKRLSRANVIVASVALVVWGLNLAPPEWIASVRALLPVWIEPMPIHNAESRLKMRNAAALDRYYCQFQAHSMATHGRYPASLAEVSCSMWKEPSETQYCDPRSGRLLDWIYFPGYTNSSPGAVILLASPNVDGTSRMVLAADGQISEISEIQFVKLIGDQPPREW